MSTKRIMRKFRLSEISLVDNPAQEGARIAILKRDDISKARALTTVVDGHSHSIITRDDSYGHTDYANDHSHPWIMDAEGNMILATVNGHTHEVAVMAKTADGVPDAIGGETVTGEQAADSGSGDDNSMSDTTKAADDLAAKNDRLERIVALNPAHRAHFDSLAGDVADQFLAKSDSDRDDIVKRSQEADAVVYKADDGTEFRKSDDQRLIEMAKRADADRRELAAERAITKRRDLEKRATDAFRHLGGDAVTKADLLGAIETIDDESRRTAVLEAVKAHDAGLGKAFSRTPGATTAGTDVTKSATDQLMDMATSVAKEREIPFGKALDIVAASPEGRELYEAHRSASYNR